MSTVEAKNAPRHPQCRKNVFIKVVGRPLQIQTNHACTIPAHPFSTRARKVSFYLSSIEQAIVTESKGWQCCKTRVLTFDEFLSIPPCTTGKHSTVDDTPQPKKKPLDEALLAQTAPSRHAIHAAVPRIPMSATPRPTTPVPLEDTDDDEPNIEIPDGKTCRRKACGVSFKEGQDRSKEKCIHHPGFPVFHEGSKGYSCCKRRVLEFDQFLNLEGCETKDRHLFVGSGKTRAEKLREKKVAEGGNVDSDATSAADDEERLETVRHDFYQTPTQVICSYYLKKIDKERSKVAFADATTLQLDLVTQDKKRYKADVPLFGSIDPEKSKFQIMGTKLELTLLKADGMGWPVLKADDHHTGSIIQSGRAGTLA